MISNFLNEIFIYFNQQQIAYKSLFFIYFLDFLLFKIFLFIFKKVNPFGVYSVLLRIFIMSIIFLLILKTLIKYLFKLFYKFSSFCLISVFEKIINFIINIFIFIFSLVSFILLIILIHKNLTNPNNVNWHDCFYNNQQQENTFKRYKRMSETAFEKFKENGWTINYSHHFEEREEIYFENSVPIRMQYMQESFEQNNNEPDPILEERRAQM